MDESVGMLNSSTPIIKTKSSPTCLLEAFAVIFVYCGGPRIKPGYPFLLSNLLWDGIHQMRLWWRQAGSKIKICMRGSEVMFPAWALVIPDGNLQWNNHQSSRNHIHFQLSKHDHIRLIVCLMAQHSVLRSQHQAHNTHLTKTHLTLWCILCQAMRTPLHIAASRGWVTMVQYLLTQGADVCAEDCVSLC